MSGSWRGTVDAAALVVTALGLVVGVLLLARTHRLGPALSAFLLLLTGAGLLRLSAAPTLDRVLAAGGVLAVRQLVTAGIRGATPLTGPAARLRGGLRRP